VGSLASPLAHAAARGTLRTSRAAEAAWVPPTSAGSLRSRRTELGFCAPCKPARVEAVDRDTLHHREPSAVVLHSCAFSTSSRQWLITITAILPVDAPRLRDQAGPRFPSRPWLLNRTLG